MWKCTTAGFDRLRSDQLRSDQIRSEEKRRSRQSWGETEPLFLSVIRSSSCNPNHSITERRNPFTHSLQHDADDLWPFVTPIVKSCHMTATEESVCVCDRQRQRQTNIQTDTIYTAWQTWRQTDMKTDRQTDRHIVPQVQHHSDDKIGGNVTASWDIKMFSLFSLFMFCSPGLLISAYPFIKAWFNVHHILPNIGVVLSFHFLPAWPRPPDFQSCTDQTACTSFLHRYDFYEPATYSHRASICETKPSVS